MMGIEGWNRHTVLHSGVVPYVVVEGSEDKMHLHGEDESLMH